MLLISAHDKQAGRQDGRRTDGALVCTKRRRTHICFPRPLCTCTRCACMYMAAPVSLINARPRNERLNLVCCTALHSTAKQSTAHAHHRSSSPTRAQIHGSKDLSFLFNQSCGRDHGSYPTQDGYPVLSTTIMLDTLDSWAGMHARLSETGLRQGVGLLTRGGYGHAHGLCKRRSSGLDFGKNVIPLLEGVGTNRSQIWARGGPAIASTRRPGRYRARPPLTCQGTRRPGGMGCFVVREKKKVCRSSCRPQQPVREGWDRHAGSCVTCRGPRDRTRSEKPWRIDPSDVCESESQGSEVAHEAG